MVLYQDVMDLYQLKIASCWFCSKIEDFIYCVGDFTVVIPLHKNDCLSDQRLEPTKSEMQIYNDRFACRRAIMEIAIKYR
jgi:hypothetical protein